MRHQQKDNTLLVQAEEAMRRLLDGLSLVGRDSPKAQLSWLMDFTSRDLSVPGAVETTRWEVAAFCTENYTRSAVEMSPHMVSRTVSANTTPEEWMNPFRQEDMVPLQHQVRQHLRELRATHAIQFPTPIVNGVAWAPKQAVWMETSGHTPSALFCAALVQFLVNVGKELRTCNRDECERFFLAGRPHQKYCSRQCENRVAVTRHRRLQPELPDLQHERYEKKLQQKKPWLKNTTVARRPRKKTK